MPRLSNSVPKYRKHRASGQAVVTIGGRDFYLGPHGTRASRAEYDRLISEWLAGGRSPTFGTAAAAYSIEELLAAYLPYAKAYYGDGRRGEFVNMKRAMKPLVAPYGELPAVDFGPRELKAVRQGLVARGISRSHINALVQRIVRIFRWGVAEGLVPPAVPQALAMVPGLRKGHTEAPESAPILSVDEAAVEATLPRLPSLLADMVRVQRLTGCRPAEVCTMRPCDIDRSGEVWEYRPESHKTAHHGRERVIFVGPQAQGILLRYLARDAAAFCFQPCDSEAKRRAVVAAARKTPLSCGNRPGSNRRRHPRRKPGHAYDVNTYRRAIHRACDQAFPPDGELARQTGETHRAWRGRLTKQQLVQLRQWQSDHRWSPNQLRHSAATEIRKKFGLEAAQATLGHARADVTQVYAQRDYALAARVAREVG